MTTLTINGTALADDIFSYFEDTFLYTDVVMNGFNGNDNFIMAARLSTTAYGGDGYDWFSSGGGNNSFYLYGDDGDDYIDFNRNLFGYWSTPIQESGCNW